MQSKILFDQVSQSSIQLLLQEPFYAHVLMGLLKEVRTELPCALGLGVFDRRIPVLAFQNDSWEEELLHKDQKLGALKHEILHLVLGHPLRGLEYSQRRLFHLAADLVVNQYLSETQLRPDAFTLEQLPELALAPFRSLEFYYESLEAAWYKTLRRGQDISPVLTRWMEADTGALPAHQSWADEFDILSAAERKVLAASIQDVVQQAMQRLSTAQRTALPRGLSQLNLGPNTQFSAPSLDWRRFLRIFVGAGRKTYLQSTIHQPSRRYGTTPGLRLRHRHKLLVVLDTSGSVAEAELMAFFQEIQHIWRLGTEIFILECDTQVNNAYFYRGQMPQTLSGRGDTRFDAALEYANQQADVDAVVYFTDGRGPTPQVQCRKPLLWMICGEMEATHLPGYKIPLR